MTFDLLTSGSVHAEVLPYTMCLPTLVLIAEAILVGLFDRVNLIKPVSNVHPCMRTTYFTYVHTYVYVRPSVDKKFIGFQ